MRYLLRFFQPVWIAFVLISFTCLYADKPPSEYSRFQDKLTRENNPVGKVKILIKMSDIDLQSAAQWIKKEAFSEADKHLKQYSGVITHALETLKTSHRNAQKDPSGFKEFELSLRRQLRILADLKSHYSFDRVDDISQVIATAESAQQEMFKEIFGEENTGRDKERKKHSDSGKDFDP